MFILRPTRLFAAVWILLLLGDYLLSGVIEIFFPIDNFAYYYIFLSVLALMAGGWVSFNFGQTHLILKVFDRVGPSCSRERLDGLWVFGLLVLVLLTSLERFLMIGSSWITPGGIDAYRYTVTEDGAGRLFGFLSVFNFIIFLSGAYLVERDGGISRLKKILIILCLLFFFYIGSARSLVFFVFLIYFFARLARQGFGLVTFFILLLLPILFVVVGAIVGKNDAFGLVIYAFSPVHALSQLLTGGAFFFADYGVLSFRFLQPLLSSLGLIDHPAAMLPYVETPFLTNVFTVFFVYWYDFGWLSLFVYFVFGYLLDAIYKWFLLSGSFKSLGVLCVLQSCVVLSVFYDYFTSSAFVYMVVLFLLVFFPRAGGAEEVVNR